MPTMNFTGVIRSYRPTDDGQITLGIEEINPTEAARFAVHDLIRDFNPSGGNLPYGARNTPCTVKPGFGLYSVTVPADRADLTIGTTVDVVLDVFSVRRVRFYNGRWVSISDLSYLLSSIKATPEMATAAAGVTGGTSATPGKERK